MKNDGLLLMGKREGKGEGQGNDFKSGVHVGISRWIIMLTSFFHSTLFWSFPQHISPPETRKTQACGFCIFKDKREKEVGYSGIGCHKRCCYGHEGPVSPAIVDAPRSGPLPLFSFLSCFSCYTYSNTWISNGIDHKGVINVKSKIEFKKKDFDIKEPWF